MRLVLLAQILYFFVFVLPCGIIQANLRGVDPALVHKYARQDGKFSCLDGSAVIPFSYVNDDYCDCPDGSDEPGTSACPRGRFYCRNKGHEARTIPSSFVDDGVCDCCDGSDELSQCPKKCVELGKKVLSELREQLKTYEKGLMTKGNRIKSAQGKRAEWEGELADLETRFIAQTQIVDDVKARKEALETKEREEEERLKVEAGMNAAGQQAGDGEAREGTQEECSGSCDGKAEDESGSEGEKQKQEKDQAIQSPGEEGGQEVATPSQTNTDNHGEEGIAEKVQEVEDHFNDEDEEEDDEEDKDGNGEGNGSSDYSEYDDDGEYSPSAQPMVPDAQPPANGESPSWFSGLLRRIKTYFGGLFVGRDSGDQPISHPSISPGKEKTEVQKVQEEERRQQRQLDKLSTELDELKNKLKADYGPSDQFLYLADNCFDFVQDQYTYSVCPYNKATQKEGHHSTSLGRFNGFKDNYQTMVFDRGQRCWQGPDRKLDLHFQCGAEDKMVNVQEPSRCEYVAYLQTSAACEPAKIDDLRQHMAALEGNLSAHDPTEL